MADFPETQILNEEPFSDNDSLCDSESMNDDDLVWAKLVSLNPAFEPLELKKDVITCGRKDTSDIILNKTSKGYTLTNYSGNHFIIKRENSSSTSFYTIIEDHSTNGTFVNGEKIGKGKIQVLNNNDEIALASKDNKAYIFIDKSAKDDTKWPDEVKKKYMVLKKLGEGAYGEVRLVLEKDTCQKFAMKIISKKKFTICGKNQMVTSNAQIMSEVNILKKLEHPCIIKIIEVIESTDAVFIILELVEGGELFDKIVKIEKYDEDTAKLLFYQMVLAIKYLHDQGISHRDLKPENILLKATEANETLIKVTDFGLSKFFDSASVMKTFCGTPNYLAPEVLISKGESSYTNKIDNWSLGVILYICLAGYPPFSEEDSSMALDQQIKNGKYDFPKQFWSDVSKDAIDLIKKLLTTNPDKRYTLEQVLEHKWIKSDTKMKDKAAALMYPTEKIDENSSASNGSKKRSFDKASSDSNSSEDSVDGLNESRKKRLKPQGSASTDKYSDTS